MCILISNYSSGFLGFRSTGALKKRKRTTKNGIPMRRLIGERMRLSTSTTALTNAFPKVDESPGDADVSIATSEAQHQHRKIPSISRTAHMRSFWFLLMSRAREHL